jgi:hypothetical protein
MTGYLYVRPNESLAVLASEDALALPELQKCVGGYLEALNIEPFGKPRRIVLMVNEDGLSMHLPPSVVCPPFGVIVGPVIVGVEQDGDFLPLTPEEQERVSLVMVGSPNPHGLPMLHFRRT